MDPLLTRRSKGLTGISGPLVKMPSFPGTFLGQMLNLVTADGRLRSGQVIEISREATTAQLFESTQGVDTQSTWIRYFPRTASIRLSKEMLGRTFSGSGRPIDGIPPPLPEVEKDIIGTPINPVARDKPSVFDLKQVPGNPEPLPVVTKPSRTHRHHPDEQSHKSHVLDNIDPGVAEEKNSLPQPV